VTGGGISPGFPSGSPLRTSLQQAMASFSPPSARTLPTWQTSGYLSPGKPSPVISPGSLSLGPTSSAEARLSPNQTFRPSPFLLLLLLLVVVLLLLVVFLVSGLIHSQPQQQCNYLKCRLPP